ncbi:MAG TPA: SRPBCC domain-containing protein [Micromonosporaceae bacterium]|nr:SRPBCC domain-containing protein [Micromonosporaceae bacterium]
MTTPAKATPATQVFRVYIKATPQAVWDAIVKPEWTEKYGYGGIADFDLRPGGHYRSYPNEAMKKSGAEQGYDIPDIIVDGEVIESDPPNRLVQTWRMLMDPSLAAEGFTRLTYEIKEIPGGATRLTVTHELEGAPGLAAIVSGAGEEEGAGGGWAWVLSDLKSVLETGSPLAA